MYKKLFLGLYLISNMTCLAKLSYALLSQNSVDVGWLTYALTKITNIKIVNDWQDTTDDLVIRRVDLNDFKNSSDKFAGLILVTNSSKAHSAQNSAILDCYNHYQGLKTMVHAQDLLNANFQKAIDKICALLSKAMIIDYNMELFMCDLAQHRSLSEKLCQ